MRIIIDPDLIMSAIPNYTQGRRMGLTDEETEQSAAETFEQMKESHEKQTPMKLTNEATKRNDKTCHKCKNVISQPYPFCPYCGHAIDLEVTDEHRKSK